MPLQKLRCANTSKENVDSEVWYQHGTGQISYRVYVWLLDFLAALNYVLDYSAALIAW